MSRNIDREQYIASLNEQFPEVAAKIDDISEGLLHLEMATFSRETQAAIDAQDNETVKRHFRFIDDVFPGCCPRCRERGERLVPREFAIRRPEEGRSDPGSEIAPAPASSSTGRPGRILGQAPRQGRPHLTSRRAGGASTGAFHLHKN